MTEVNSLFGDISFFPFTAIDGGYSEWSKFSECNASCGGGIMVRKRSCNNPDPQHGGKDCKGLGTAVEEKNCNSFPCRMSDQYLFIAFFLWLYFHWMKKGHSVIKLKVTTHFVWREQYSRYPYFQSNIFRIRETRWIWIFHSSCGQIRNQPY